MDNRNISNFDTNKIYKQLLQAIQQNHNISTISEITNRIPTKAQLEQIIHSNNDQLFLASSYYAHTAMLGYLIELTPDLEIREQMIRSNNYYAFTNTIKQLIYDPYYTKIRMDLIIWSSKQPKSLITWYYNIQNSTSYNDQRTPNQEYKYDHNTLRQYCQDFRPELLSDLNQMTHIFNFQIAAKLMPLMTIGKDSINSLFSLKSQPIPPEMMQCIAQQILYLEKINEPIGIIKRYLDTFLYIKDQVLNTKPDLIMEYTTEILILPDLIRGLCKFAFKFKELFSKSNNFTT